MGLFDDLTPGAPSNVTMPASGAISSIESGGRYDATGPLITSGGMAGQRANGKYQVMDSNVGPWTRQYYGRELTPEQFRSDPKAQEAVFAGEFGRLAQKYGPGGAARAWFAGEGGMNDLGRKDQLGTTVGQYGQRFAAAGGAQPPGNLFADLTPKQSVVGERFAEIPAPANAPKLQAGLERRATELTTGEPISPAAQMAVQHGNLLSAASQGTNPNIETHKQPISTEVFQDDAGNISYRDPQTGAIVPTDQTKHVALRDPTDNTVKIYARTPDTNEGTIVGVSRVLSPGLISGAPTARAAIPAATAAVNASEGQRVAEAAQRLGVDVPRAVTTDNMTVQRIASAAKNIPFGGNPLVKGAERATAQLGDREAALAAGYGSGEVRTAGDAAKTSITNWISKESAANANTLYDRVDKLIDPAVTVPLQSTSKLIGEISAARTAAALPEGKAVASVLDAATSPTGLTYQGIKTLRTSIGEQLSSGILPEGMSGAELKRIYGALSDDLKSSVRAAGGPAAEAAFEKANRYNSLISDRRASLAKIVGADGNAPAEQVFDRVVAMASSSARGDIERLMQARKAIGTEGWNEIASAVIARLGRDPDGKFSPQRFMTAFGQDGKLSKEGKAILFRSTGNGSYAQSLDDIATVSRRFKELAKFGNPSGTAQNVVGAAGIIGGGSALFHIDPITTIGGMLGARVLSTVLAKPATAASLAHWSKTYAELAATPSIPKVAMFQLASRNLANNLKDVGVTLSPADFMNAIQSPVKSAAEGEQQTVPRRPGE